MGPSIFDKRMAEARAVATNEEDIMELDMIQNMKDELMDRLNNSGRGGEINMRAEARALIQMIGRVQLRCDPELQALLRR